METTFQGFAFSITPQYPVLYTWCGIVPSPPIVITNQVKDRVMQGEPCSFMETVHPFSTIEFPLEGVLIPSGKKHFPRGNVVPLQGNRISLKGEQISVMEISSPTGESIFHHLCAFSRAWDLHARVGGVPRQPQIIILNMEEIIMPKQTYAEVLNSAKVMSAGLGGHIERVSKRGISEDFIRQFESLRTDAMKLDDEQEDLKAKLKTKTAELDRRMGELLSMMSEAKKVVKLEMEKESWKSFGIADTR